jgi:hypothetical protein
MMVPDAPRRKGNASPDRPPTIADAPDGDDAPYAVDSDTAAAPICA